jgi:micrococcal nuclease
MSRPGPERVLGIVAVLVLAGAVVAFVALTSGPTFPGVATSGEPRVTDGGPDGSTERAEVIRVVDGDTIVVRIGGDEERVRYIGLDAPEVADAGAGTAAECGADEARAVNERLVVGEPVVLERDVSDRDRFGRLLRHAWLEAGGWRLIGLELVEAGAVEARSYPPDTGRDAQLDAAERSARDLGAGIWGACR